MRKQLLQGDGRHEAGAAQTVGEQIGETQRDEDDGLASGDVLDVSGVRENQSDMNAPQRTLALDQAPDRGPPAGDVRALARRAISRRSAAQAFNRVAYAAAHVVADPLVGEGPVARAGGRLGRDARLPPPSLGARLRRRRGDGHRAARHGARLADLARADPPLDRRRARLPGRVPRERRRHRPSRAGTEASRSTT